MLQYTIIKTAINLSPAESLPIIGRDALLALVNWFERQWHHDPSSPIQDMAARAYGAAAAADCPAEPDGDAVPADDKASGGAPPWTPPHATVPWRTRGVRMCA